MNGKCRILRDKIQGFGLWNCVIGLVGMEGLARTYCFHLLMVCEYGPRLLLQNIHNHATHYTNVQCKATT